jgi:DNA replication and repair protein RecF
MSKKAQPDLHLEKLILTQFKNYALQSIDCSPTLNCFVGNNGMGKTNLLDAVYYLCMGKSYFNTVDAQLVCHGQDFFRLEGHFIGEDRKEQIVVKVIPRKKKEVERNGVPYQKLSEHVGLLPVVMIAPDDTYLVTEGSEARRRLVDNTLSQFDPQYLQHLIRYNKLLKQRNALLKQLAENRTFDTTLLETYDLQMQPAAAYITQQRRLFLDDFIPVVTKYYAQIANQQEEVGCRYQTKLEEVDFIDLLLEHREKDRVLQRTTAGPHRDDIEFELEGRPLKRFASQGQLKSFVLALKLAQYDVLKTQKNRKPILLLDDIFDKLDINRVTQLLKLLLASDFGQIFLTDTHTSRIQEIVNKFQASYQMFTIVNGSANP